MPRAAAKSAAIVSNLLRERLEHTAYRMSMATKLSEPTSAVLEGNHSNADSSFPACAG